MFQYFVFLNNLVNIKLRETQFQILDQQYYENWNFVDYF